MNLAGMPSISVCMPYWNRRDELERSLWAYKRIYPDLDLEFSICDDGSSVPLRHTFRPPMCRTHLTELPQKTFALNPCVPINQAIRAAKHDLIVLTNPEVEHTERVLEAMYAALESDRHYVTASCHDDKLGWIGGPQAPKNRPGMQPIPRGTELHWCAMFHRSLWQRAGGFDEEYRNGLGCDDNDWLWRLWALGDTQFVHVDRPVKHYRTPHRRWRGSLQTNVALLRKKWDHLEEFRCAS